YKYNTFRRQKQEVLKPKNRLGCGKGFLPLHLESALLTESLGKWFSSLSACFSKPAPSESHLLRLTV
ncbi:hypothetical protein, partial [Prevotellamassilia timonensis]|uniref:hypothetical protein n=1 Tax=Prevotellamassilia timonensis TaxID=1852370 RepID=UPI001F48B6E0